MQNRGKLPFSWQFTLFVVSSHIAVGICSTVALKSRKPLTIAQKGFLHDKERMDILLPNLFLICKKYYTLSRWETQNQDLKSKKNKSFFLRSALVAAFLLFFLPQPTNNKDVSININDKASETIFFLFNILYFISC